MKNVTETEIDFEAAGSGDHGLNSMRLPVPPRPKLALKMEIDLLGNNINIPIPEIAQGKRCVIKIEVLP